MNECVCGGGKGRGVVAAITKQQQRTSRAAKLRESRMPLQQRGCNQPANDLFSAWIAGPCLRGCELCSLAVCLSWSRSGLSLIPWHHSLENDEKRSPLAATTPPYLSRSKHTRGGMLTAPRRASQLQPANGSHVIPAHPSVPFAKLKFPLSVQAGGFVVNVAPRRLSDRSCVERGVGQHKHHTSKTRTGSV